MGLDERAYQILSRSRRRREAAAAPWTPADTVVAKHLWMDGHMVGDDWVDLYVPTESFSQSTGANRPANNTVGGKPCITFNGTSHWIRRVGWTGPAAGGVAYLVKRNAADPPAAGDGLWMFSTDVIATSFVPYQDGNIYESFGSTARKDAIAANPGATMTAVHLYEARSFAGHFSYYMNGVLLGTTATNTVGWHGNPRFGTNSDAETFWFAGDLFEFLLVGDASDQANFYTYFENKYGLVLP